jgi:cobalamin biosynthesis protein CobC
MPDSSGPDTRSDDDLLHGGGLAGVMARYPDAPTPWIDLSTGINPWPYPHTGLSADALAKLPDTPMQQRARKAAAAAFGCAPEHVALTAGSQAAIQLAPLLHPARRVAIVSPTYSEHAQSWARSSAEIIEVSNLPDARDRFDAVIAVNPNNPDGRIHSRADLLALAADLSARGGCLIVDEAFADLDPAISIANAAGADGLIVLRSFGKFYGLAGLRLGAILAPNPLIARAKALLGPWPVSGPALAIAARAYDDTAWQTATRTRLTAAAASLDTALQRHGLEVTGGTSLYRWIKTPNAHALWRRLAERGVYVRRFSWTTTHLRIGLPADEAALSRLIEALL